MSFTSLLISNATIWNVAQSTALGISESTSFSAYVDCRINVRRGGRFPQGEGRIDEEEANIGSHVIFLESDVSIDTEKQLVSNGIIYHAKNVREIYGRKSLHHYEVDVDAIE